jgi:hypothetical protein
MTTATVTQDLEVKRAWTSAARAAVIVLTMLVLTIGSFSLGRATSHDDAAPAKATSTQPATHAGPVDGPTCPSRKFC